MKCPNNIRECPNGWTDCELCANLQACNEGTYIPEPKPELTEPELATDLGLDIQESVEKIQDARTSERGTWSEKFAKMTPDERLAEIYRYHPPSLHDKDPIPLDGPSAPGGGSKSKRHKNPMKKTPEYMKFLGM